MSAPYASDEGDGESHASGPLENADDVLDFMQQAIFSREGPAYSLEGLGSGHDDDADDDDDDDDDDEYHDAGDGEEDEDEDGQEGEFENEDDDEDDEDDENYFVDEGRPTPYLTQRQVNMLLRGEGLHNVLFSVEGWGAAHDDDDPRTRSRRRRQQPPDPNRFPKVPSDEGRKLMDSGTFGASEWARTWSYEGSKVRPVPLRLLDREMGLSGRPADRLRNERMIAQGMVPASQADMVVRYRAPVYLGQFSDDGNFFYSATKDFVVRMYDTSNVNNWRYYKTAVHPTGRWTLTDASLSPDNRWLAFTSMLPQVCLTPTDPNDEGDPYSLNLSGSNGNGRSSYSFAIFSVRFSGDGRELVAGTNDSSIILYDIESRTVLHHLEGHDSDVNAVCFGDRTSPHLLYSGSDDATIKVWDRRSLGDRRPAGVFVGHCEGVTYIDSKGDGRYILSNGKDQTMRLWDLRMAMTNADFEGKDPARLTRYSLYDYRFQRYNDDLYFKHPYDNSVVTFRGHRVERTLIRCHFSPPASSDARYVYSASHSGKVYIWNLDATLAGVIDVRNANHNVVTDAAQEYVRDLSDDDDLPGLRQPPPPVRRRARRYKPGPVCVRDASWHPTAPFMVASGFDAESMDTGSCSLHSCAISHDGKIGPGETRLFDDKLKPLSGLEAGQNAQTSWWAM